MPVLHEIKNIKIDDELRVCPECGYEFGFHTSFLKLNAGKNPPVIKSTREVYMVILLCPECGARYDVGWRVSFTETENRVIRTTGNQITTV
jgi:ribosomal protein S27AE